MWGNLKVNSNLGALGQVNIRDLSSKLIYILIYLGLGSEIEKNIRDYENCQSNLIGGSFQVFFFFLIGITPCKAEQPLQSMDLQERETQKD